MLGIIISYIKISVTKITTAGTEIVIQDYTAIPVILSIIVLYFLVVFIFNALDEYSKYHHKNREDVIERITAGKAYSFHDINLKVKSINEDIIKIENATRYSGNEETILTNNAKIKELKQEVDRLEMVLTYYQYSKASIYERIKLEGIKDFVNIYLPMFVGLYSIIILLFFTHFPNIDVDANNSTPQKLNSSISISKTDTSSAITDTSKQ
jgi:hypothetical protein